MITIQKIIHQKNNENMDKIKEYGNIAIDEIKKWYFINWNDGLYNRGKTIFVSVVAFFVLIKIIYSIFA